jgi:hypothetical protein
MNSMKKIIRYFPFFEYHKDSFIPAKKTIPQWYKDMPTTKEYKDNFDYSMAKKCSPFLDAMTSGYSITLPCDIWFDFSDGFYNVKWKDNDTKIVGARDKNDGLLIPEEYSEERFTWSFPITLKIPIGYSALITHPLNQYDLPFLTLSGVIDGGFALYANGNVPFMLKKNFSGIIKQGTPIMQVIPFKTQDWHSVVDEKLKKEGFLNQKRSIAVFAGWYKKEYWKRKNYL